MMIMALRVFKILVLLSLLKPIAASWKPHSVKSERTFGRLSFENSLTQVVSKIEPHHKTTGPGGIDSSSHCSYGVGNHEDKMDGRNKMGLASTHSRRTMLDAQRDDYRKNVIMVSSWD